MSAGQTKCVIKELLSLVNRQEIADEHDYRTLERILDQLALARHSMVGDFVETSTDPPTTDRTLTKSALAVRFPELGLYNIPEHVTSHPMEGGLKLGDASDDLLDIVLELQDVLWHFEQTGNEAAYYNYAWGYDNHWRYHLRGLLWYLEMKRFESD
ncbi:MAG: hypothetical protein KA230_03520 [Flavobacteriales bacterium]|nr:hypothetical protein [Flavobacteriales bacterium]